MLSSNELPQPGFKSVVEGAEFLAIMARLRCECTYGLFLSSLAEH